MLLLYFPDRIFLYGFGCHLLEEISALNLLLSQGMATPFKILPYFYTSKHHATAWLLCLPGVA
jgi:hypothetical protein